MASNKYLTVNEFAELVALAPDTIRRMIRRGDIKARRVSPTPRSVYRIHLSELENFGAAV